MTILQAVILGIVQGLTEFLPVSSSAHLVLVPYFLGWHIPQEQVFPFDVLVQVGTLLAVIIYFRKDLYMIIKAMVSSLAKGKPFEVGVNRLGWLIILASVPAGVVGILLKDTVEKSFQSPLITGLFLLGTAILLVAAEYFKHSERDLDDIGTRDSLWIGITQALSIFPGISRSGATISGGMSRHIRRESAARFSFLMAVPIMAAAGLLSILDLLSLPNLQDFLPVMAIGLITSFVIGYLAIHWLLGYLKSHSLRPFALYCFSLGAIAIILNYVL
jgi:undecaprenyl-diphosphatase